MCQAAWQSRDGLDAVPDEDADPLSRSLQRISTLTHLALLTHAVHRESEDIDDDDESDRGSPQVSSPRQMQLQSCVMMQRLPTAAVVHRMQQRRQGLRMNAVWPLA